MNFLFRSKQNSELIWDAWSDFERRIRWHLKFTFENNQTLYDPDYELNVPLVADPPVLPAYLERGLDKGRLFVKSMIANMPEQVKDESYNMLVPSPHRIKEFLVANDYVVTNTDKNLGIAVSQRDWIITKCEDLLGDSENYTPLDQLTANSIFDLQCTEMEAIAVLCEAHLPNPQICQFM
jgi:hypothetical protein